MVYHPPLPKVTQLFYSGEKPELQGTFPEFK